MSREPTVLLFDQFVNLELLGCGVSHQAPSPIPAPQLTYRHPDEEISQMSRGRPCGRPIRFFVLNFQICLQKTSSEITDLEQSENSGDAK